ncbi:MAG: hypothetical protein PHS57_07875 [Alphaproteobacteria bacterium]|nr:hypothetical protein [Alphaproteobacteria bacterium]
MIDFRPHKLCLSLFALATLIGLGSEPFLGFVLHKAERKYHALQQENRETIKAIKQLRDDMAAVKKMGSEIDEAAARKYLAPVNRLKAAHILEQRAIESFLSHLTYTLSPEKRAVVNVLNAQDHQLVLSDWKIAADAPTDLDVYTFFDSLRRTLPGRLTISSLSLRRIDANLPLSEANIHVAAEGTWLSNGAGPALTEAP